MLNSNIFYCDFQEIIPKINELETSSILLVVDENILQLYKNQFEELKNNLHSEKKMITWTCIYGETTKTIPEYERCIEYFLQEGVNRNSHLIAWGGGATSDFAGFVAATILRGISWSVIPTTLLSIIDASIGGKVAVNTRLGKNLIGAFHLPENIWIDLSFIKTLSKNELASGQGELIKYLLLSDQIYKRFKETNQLNELISDCISFKEKIVEQDQQEKLEIRKILNFGHTFGHVMEVDSFLPHGVAVTWGMILITKLYSSDEVFIEVLEIIRDAQLDIGNAPWINNFNIDEVITSISKDKKSQGDEKIDLVVLKKIGTPIIISKKISEIKQDMKERMDDIQSIIL